jgi:methyltransferase (TIGR00027 family)
VSGAGPSRTAIGAAILRAAHRLLDGSPSILDDPYALPLSGLPGEAAVTAAVTRMEGEFTQRSDPKFAREVVRHLRATIVLRNRYAEDALAEARARGIRQYVLLGAGLDSFALRAETASDGLQVFELDLPATQDWKRQRLRALGLPLPPSLQFVAADLERQSPMEALAGSRFRHEEPAFFSWLGVTGYLSEAAVFATLENLRGAAPGSEVVFSYGLPEARIGADGRRLHEVLKAGLAARGEPAANSGFDPGQLAGRLEALGYTGIGDFSVADAQRRYFDGRGDGLGAPPMNHLMRARVA